MDCFGRFTYEGWFRVGRFIGINGKGKVAMILSFSNVRELLFFFFFAMLRFGGQRFSIWVDYEVSFIEWYHRGLRERKRERERGVFLFFFK